jgi:hypothetical protein
MEGDGNEEVRNPGGSRALPGNIEEAGKGTIKIKSAVELEAVDGLAQRLFIKAAGDGPGKIRRMEEAFPADMIASANGGKRESTARTTRGGDGEKAAKTTRTEGGVG